MEQQAVGRNLPHFPRTDDVHLVNLVKLHPSLYTLGHKYHRVPAHREAMWKQIALALGRSRKYTLYFLIFFFFP